MKWIIPAVLVLLGLGAYAIVRGIIRWMISAGECDLDAEPTNEYADGPYCNYCGSWPRCRDGGCAFPRNKTTPMIAGANLQAGQFLQVNHDGRIFPIVSPRIPAYYLDSVVE